MSLQNFTIITSSGLDFCTSAYDGGPLIKIAYFLPVYDYRIDNLIMNGTDTSVIELSAAALPGDTIPTGEVIYNIDIGSGNTYTQSPTDDWVISAGGETLDDSGDPWIVTNSIMSKPQMINLYNGNPLQNYISGSDVDASATSNAWEIYDGGLVSGDNSVPAEVVAGTSRYFEVVGYNPVTDGNILKGSFKCRLNKKIGGVKFNKIALYVVQVDNNGVETSSPALFAQAMLSSPVLKANYGTSGFDDLIFDVQIQLTSPTTNFSDVFFATSADYWQRTPGGVHYSEKVSIGIFEDNAKAAKAKLHIKDSNLPQLRLDYGAGSALTSAALSATENGDLMLMMDSGKSVFPQIGFGLNLGNGTGNAFQGVYTNRLFVNVLSAFSSSILFDGNLLPLTPSEFEIGGLNQRLKNIHTVNLSASDTIRVDKIKALTSISPANNIANLGSLITPWNRIYVNGIYGSEVGSETVLATNLIPNTDEIYIGTNNNKIAAGNFKNIWLGGRVVGIWTKANRDFYAVPGQNNNGKWGQVPSTWDTDYVFNGKYWNNLLVQNLNYTIINKTLIITFKVSFTKNSEGLGVIPRISELCALIPTSSNSDLLNLVPNGIQVFSNSKRSTINDEVLLNVEYKSNILNEGKIGWELTTNRRETTEVGFDWIGESFEYSVQLIHELA